MTAPVVIGNAKRLRILSLGAGVQSSTIALMMAHGEITPPDVAIFADTKAEPIATYAYLEWLRGRLPFDVDVVSKGDLGAEILATSRGEARNDARPPFYIRNQDGSGGMLRRQCTGDYKIDVIRKRVRELLGVPKGTRVPDGHHVTQVIGISLDEIQRMKSSVDRWQSFEHPLITLRMTRWDCERWLLRNGYPIPPKSACTFCPYRSDLEWRRLRDDSPKDFAYAVEIDRAIGYVHRSMVPLEDVDLSTAAERGQPDLWQDECSGVCGV